MNPSNPFEASAPVQSSPGIELWGGVEYTFNRVENRYFDQMELSGHSERLTDYDKFAELGIRTLRTGLLWERFERTGSWEWSDKKLARLNDLGISAIAGLVHHGSGPEHTDLLDPEFPQKLAAYAGQVAQRYPQIDAYTPVNEPNTTARFSGLYGTWYPHHQSRGSYLRALLNQLKGTVLSMRAIRRVRQDAKLIQTDDVGSIVGTSQLRSTAELLNLRQWLTFDLLCGHVDRHHPMFEYMQREGISDADIHWFSDNPCPPSVIGLNYYATSDRYIDHQLDMYPEQYRSAEGRHVDIEAVRVLPQHTIGVGSLLRKAWERYSIASAVTEVHLGCSVEEQIRWMADSWEAVMSARRDGVECIALTAWALLGSFYWNELVTSANGHYEPGVFDVRSGHPIPTELATIVAQIAAGEAPRHHALTQRGWWRDPSRICLPRPESRAA